MSQRWTATQPVYLGSEPRVPFSAQASRHRGNRRESALRLRSVLGIFATRVLRFGASLIYLVDERGVERKGGVQNSPKPGAANAVCLGRSSLVHCTYVTRTIHICHLDHVGGVDPDFDLGVMLGFFARM